MTSSGPARPTANVISKPDCPSSLCVTSSLRIARITCGGTGTATVGPISSVTRTPSSVMSPGPRSWLRQRHAQRPPDVGGRVGWIHGVVGAAHPPEVRGVAQRPVADEVQAVALGHLDLHEQRQLGAPWQEPPANVRDHAPVGLGARRRLQALVSASRVEHQTIPAPPATSARLPALPIVPMTSLVTWCTRNS